MQLERDFLDNSIYFDASWYKQSYSDVSLVNMDPREHFFKYGVKLHRIGSLLFKNHEEYYSYLSDKQCELEEARKLKLSVDDLIKKMKSGFQSLSLHLLNDAVEDFNGRDNKERAKASWELAKAYATLGEWERVEFYLKKTRYLNAAFMRKKRPKLLEIEALTRTGQFVKATDRLSYPLSKAVDGDFICALSNMLYYKRDEDSTRIDALNRIYSASGLSDIEKKMGGLSFSFLNLSASTASKVVSDKKISVLMPVYNAAPFIELSVGSLLSQTYENIEIIAVDDRSTDKSYSILLELAEKDERLKVFRNSHNSGAYPTRNRALQLATGDIITVHDSDDWSHPQMLEKQAQLLEHPDVKITFSFMVRVSENLEFSLRPERNNMEYIHRSYPSLMIRKADLELLGEWDAISANADDEFVQRARIVFGNDNIIDVLPEVPLSFFLKHSASLTSDPKTSLKSLDYGVRKEYALQAKFWRETQDGFSLSRKGSKNPFPVPNGLNPENRHRSMSYDLVIISDLTLLGGTRRCNQAYIEAAKDLGLRVAIFHWPRYDLKFVEDVAPEYRELSFDKNVDIITWEEEIKARCVIIHHPPILKFEPDDLPKISTSKVAILVNQSPKQLRSQEPHYYFEKDVEKLCNRIFGVAPLWISISPTARDILRECGYENIVEEIWYPPISESFLSLLDSGRKSVVGSRSPVIGRHARDHWTKWPSLSDALRSAYLADSKYRVEFLGGAQTAEKALGYLPKNWVVHEFDSMGVSSFLENLDFFVHFPHEDYIEEFGRNIAEAMASRIVVILPPSFEKVFADAAVYCLPHQVQHQIELLWNDKNEFDKKINTALKFVSENLRQTVVAARVKKLISWDLSA